MDSDYEDYKVMEYMHKGYSYLEAKDKVEELMYNEVEERLDIEENFIDYEADVFDD